MGKVKSCLAITNYGKEEYEFDQEGRLSLDADDKEYQVGDEDMIAFQEILRDKLKAN